MGALQIAVKEREKESRILFGYIESFLRNGKGSIVYISGVPGSGKTYTVQKILKGVFPSHIYINCATIRKKSGIYQAIYSKIPCCEKDKGRSYLAGIQAHLKTCSTKHCIVIDEIDLLINKKQDVLYNIFDLPYIDSSRLMIISIANTMNLPENLLDPKVFSRVGGNRINFVSYTHEQLFSIVPKENRFRKGSIELATKRIASVGGDVRKVLDVVTRAAEQPKEDITVYDMDSVMKKMNRPIYYLFLESLSFYQKLILFILSTGAVVKTSELHDKLKTYCKLRDLKVIDFFVFLDILGMLSSYRILALKDEHREVHLLLLKQEIQDALKNDRDFCSFSV